MQAVEAETRKERTVDLAKEEEASGTCNSCEAAGLGANRVQLIEKLVVVQGDGGKWGTMLNTHEASQSLCSTTRGLLRGSWRSPQYCLYRHSLSFVCLDVCRWAGYRLHLVPVFSVWTCVVCTGRLACAKGAARESFRCHRTTLFW